MLLDFVPTLGPLQLLSFCVVFETEVAMLGMLKLCWG